MSDNQPYVSYTHLRSQTIPLCPAAITPNFNRVAHEFWQDRPGHGQQIAEALAAFIQARESYLRALTDLRPKLTDLAAQVPEHDHLDPIEKYREIVRARMFADVAPPV